MRVNAYIDGYNLYHAVVKLNDNRLKWLNLRALCQHFCDEWDKLDKVYYFTAYAEHIKGNGDRRHKIYIDDFLKDFGVEAIFGHFNTFEGETKEKQTDINIALQMYEDAIYNKYDKAILLSADTDFIPAIEKVNNLGKEVLQLLLPQHNYSSKFDKVIKHYYCINKNDLESHLLPAKNKNGKEMPKEYLSNIQSTEQPSSLTQHLKIDSWIPKEFPQCEKCKDYLDYSLYENIIK
ncbi:NYN domain-containing protein [Helicobacter sp. T3_23-1059]